MEMRVYGINMEEEHEIVDFLNATDSQWQAESEKQGWVWSLQGFITAFNNSEVPMESFQIRIINI